MIYAVLEKNGYIFETNLLLDSGADFSMLRRDVAEDGLGVNLDKLKQTGKTHGISGGETPISEIEADITFTYKKHQRTEKLPFQISLDEKKETPENILGRIPFFYNYRIDFRMGFTDDPALGKFWMYPEKKKRDSGAYGRPMELKK
jgi:hypothetical protein